MNEAAKSVAMVGLDGTTDLPISEPKPTNQETTMNTKPKSINFHRMIVTAVVSGLALSFAAICPAADSSDVPQRTVKFADLNISSPQGAASLYTRIRVAADAVCRTLDRLDLTSKALFDRCVHKAIADAVTKVDQPALYAVYNAKNKTSKPIMLASGQTR